MQNILLSDLLLGFIPVSITLGFIFYWSMSLNKALLAVTRMLLQLILIGYALNFIFASNNAWVITLILSLMLIAASWISLNSIEHATGHLYAYSLIAISVGGVFTMVIVTQGILHADPWYYPEIVIPIAGMIFSNSMNTISLAAERFYSEYHHKQDYVYCRNTAFQASMIPVINALLAVGLVSLPGMMTGQILSGVSPLIAARYQIMVMLMVFGSSGISAALFLIMLKKRLPPLEPIVEE